MPRFLMKMATFGNFCSDDFWNIDETWNSEVPDFTSCFQDIVFTSAPSFIFSCIFLISILRLKRPLSHGALTWTWLNITKISISLTMLIVSISWCAVISHEKYTGINIPPSTLLSSCTRIMLFIFTTMIMFKHRTCAVTTSYILSAFWLLLTLCAIVLQRSSILKYFKTASSSTSDVIFILCTVYYSLIYFQLLLTIFPDKRSFEALQENKVIDDVTLFSFLSFSWFNRYIYKSRKHLLAVSDLGFLSVRSITTYVYEAFSKNWRFQTFPEVLKSKSLVWALMKSFWPWLVLAIVCDLLCLFIKLSPPILLDRIIDFARHDHYAWRGYFYAGLVFVVDVLGKSLQSNGIFFYLSGGAQIKSALMNSIYRKNLLLSTSSRKDYSSGSISNLLSVDIQRLAYFTWRCSVIITAPIRTVFVIFIMWQYMGPSTFAGVAVVILLIPISFYFARYNEKFTAEQMKIKDTRLKYLNEILGGIKIIKLYAWELPFSAKVTEARKKELKSIFYSQICYILTLFLVFIAPVLISIATFSIFLLVDKNNTLDPTRAFVCLLLSEQLKFSMFQLPDAISELIQCNISLGRLKQFFAAENMNLTVVGNKPEPGDVLTMKQASFTWAIDADHILNDIDLNIPKGKLVAVIGPVGSGKSSLLSAILGEMYKTGGSVDVKGSFAYVPQQAWILNQTVKNNILMMKYIMEERYNQILDLCCLKPDLEILPAGDETEIGEKGVNLSGGQKQRVSLARAVYQDKDIYLLDDTLSAVDVNVRKALFDDIIGNEGLLRKKTRILVTHDLSVLHKVDIIVSMKNGQIDEIGTYQELLKHAGSFTSFIQEHTSKENLEENTKMNKRMLTRYMSIDSTASQLSENSGSNEYQQASLDKDVTYRLIEDERMEIGKVNRRIYWNYITTVGIPLSALTFIGFTSTTVSETCKNIWLSEWSSDSSINGTLNTPSTVWRLGIFGALGLSHSLGVLLGGITLIYGSVRASGKYHSKMLSSILESPMSFFDCTPIGRITNRFSSDLDILDVELANIIFGCCDAFFFILGAFYIVGSNAPIFFAYLVPLAVIYYFLQKLYLRAFRQIRRLESTTKSPIYSQLLESIQGVSSISAYKAQDDFTKRFEEKVDNHMVCYLSTIACNRWLNFLLDAIGSAIVLIATFLTIENRHNLTPAEVGLMMTYALCMTNDIKWLVEMTSELEDKSISVERVTEYCHLKSEAIWKCPRENLPEEWPLNGDILFKNYSTKYRDDLDFVLTDINLSVNGGEKVGIVGRTGAGKSSITMTLFRIIEPVSGSIFIDDVDIKDIGLHSLRSNLTIIPQDPVLFTGTLRTNLDQNNEYSDDALWKSLERSHLKEFVINLEEGLEHNIEEGGCNLSGGQKQLVCLARALLKNTKILILDEATASVDMETDNLIQNTIRTAFSKNTVITIAHRLNTVLDYDKVVVLENGSVMEVGNPKKLLQNKESRFYEMARDAGLI